MIYQILQELASTSSTIEKTNILTRHKDNEELQMVFSYALSPLYKYYIKETTYPKNIQSDETSKLGISNFLPFLSKLYNRELTGHAAINVLANELEKYNSQIQDVIRKIILKDLKCNVSDKIVNKVWDNLIPTVPYMRCSGPDKLKNIIYPCIIQKKSDGSFCNIIIRDGTVLFLTRNGSEFRVPYLEEIINKALLMYPELDNYVLIGELLSYNNGIVEDRKTGNGKITKLIRSEDTMAKATAIKQIQLQEEYDFIGQNLGIDLWDTIPYENWVGGIYKEEYQIRLQTLDFIIQRLNSNKFNKVLTKYIYSIDEMNEFNKLMIESGFEGSIIKNSKAIFKDGTSVEQCKYKSILEADLICTGWYYGKPGSDFEKGLGGLNFESADGLVKVDVGSGFSRTQRGLRPVVPDNIAKGLEPIEGIDFDKEFVGKVCVIEYNELIESRDRPGIYSLFLPIFVEVRMDKDIPDNLEKIKQGI